MADRPFRNPLLAKLDADQPLHNSGPWRGADICSSYWRADAALHARIALQVCRDAVDGWISPSGLAKYYDAWTITSLSISKSRRSSAAPLKIKNVRPYQSSNNSRRSVVSSPGSATSAKALLRLTKRRSQPKNRRGSSALATVKPTFLNAFRYNRSPGLDPQLIAKAGRISAMALLCPNGSISAKRVERHLAVSDPAGHEPTQATVQQKWPGNAASSAASPSTFSLIMGSIVPKSKSRTRQSMRRKYSRDQQEQTSTFHWPS